MVSFLFVFNRQTLEIGVFKAKLMFPRNFCIIRFCYRGAGLKEVQRIYIIFFSLANFALLLNSEDGYYNLEGKNLAAEACFFVYWL